MHDNSMSSMRVIDLFCGCGGASSGFAASGATIIAAFDNDPVQLAHHRLNHPHARHVCAELGKQDPVAFGRELAELAGGPFHLHASPPCTSFSRLNPNATPSELVVWTVAVIKAAAPLTWSIENVTRAVRFFKEMVPELFTDPLVGVFPQVCGWHYGAPVLRRRLFLGVGFDLSIPPQIDPTKVSLKRFMPYLTDEHYVRDEATNKCESTNGARGTGKRRRYRPEVGEILRTVNLPTYAPRCNGRNQLWRANADGVGYHSDRILTVREVATVQGFSPSWLIPERMSYCDVEFHDSVLGDDTTLYHVRSTKASVTVGVGNSVCPPVAEAVGVQAQVAHLSR